MSADLCPRCTRAPAGVTHLCHPIDWVPPEPAELPEDTERLAATTAAACEVLGHFTHIGLGHEHGCMGRNVARAVLEAAHRFDIARAATPRGLT